MKNRLEEIRKVLPRPNRIPSALFGRMPFSAKAVSKINIPQIPIARAHLVLLLTVYLLDCSFS